MSGIKIEIVISNSKAQMTIQAQNPKSKGFTPSARGLGYYGEKMAVQYLVSQGYEILKTNYTIRGGEIDIIARRAARKSNILVFIEVKTRQTDSFGAGEDSINFWKRRRLQRAINNYLHKTFESDPDYRVDIIEITLDKKSGLQNIEHFEDVEM